MLGYRSFFSTDTVGLDKVVESQFHSWLRDKGLMADDVGIGRTQVAEATFVDLVIDSPPDGSLRRRFRLVEPGGWSTQVTAESTPDGGWVWLEINQPATAGWTATPGLLRKLIGASDARDGLADLRDKPSMVRSEALDDLLDVVCDPDRRGLVFVAGSSDDLPWGPWSTTVANVLAETVGLAGSCILDASATIEFAERIGAAHAVPAGAIRTFLPEADPASDWDARRHRILGPSRLASTPERHLRRMLGRSARRQLLDLPLPPRISRVDRALQRVESEMLVSQLTGTAVAALQPVTAPTEPASAPDNVTPVEPHRGAPLETTETVAVEAEAYLVLRQIVHDVLGVEEVRESSVAEVIGLAKSGLVVLANQNDVRARLDALQSAVEQLEDDRALLQTELDDSRLDHADDLEATIHLEDKVRYLQRQLERTGQAAIAWAEVPADDRTRPPDSFADLFDRRSELRHVVVMADDAPALELDERDFLGTCAAKAWGAMLALDDYAEVRSQQLFSQGVHAYLKETPAGYRGYSANQHSPVESDSIKNNPKYRDARVFRVPPHIDPTGRRYMDAHFKLGAKRTISPRLHYLDTVTVDSKIYVGYVGAHLRSPQTN